MTTDTQIRGRGKRLPPETRQNILDALKAHVEVKEIAKNNNVSLPTVYAVKKKLKALGV